MQRNSRRRFCVSTALAAPMIAVLAAGPAGAANTGLVGGGAYGESVNVATVLGGLVTSGPAPSVTLPAAGGGPFTASQLSANVPGVLSAGLIDVSTQGGLGAAGFVRSSAQIANVSALTGTVTASSVGSSCAIDAAGVVTGSTTLVNALLLGGSLAAKPAPNTVVAIPLVGTITLNEQTTTTGPGGNRSITVNAAHLRLTGVLTGDVILAQARCSSRV